MTDQVQQSSGAADRAGLISETGVSAPEALSAAQLVQNYGQLPEDGHVEAVRLHLISSMMLQLTFVAGLYG